MHGHGTEWHSIPSAPRFAISMAAVQVSMDACEKVSLQTGYTCLSTSEVLIVIHQPKKGRDPALDKISPEMKKFGRDELAENFN